MSLRDDVEAYLDDAWRPPAMRCTAVPVFAEIRVEPTCDHPACAGTVEHWPGAVVCRAADALPTLDQLRARAGHVRLDVSGGTPSSSSRPVDEPGEGHPPGV